MTCATCGYPTSSSECDNPACAGNPSIPAHIKQQRAEQAIKQAAEQAEREKLARIRNACFAK
jgi:hypothetical protein